MNGNKTILKIIRRSAFLICLSFCYWQDAPTVPMTFKPSSPGTSKVSLSCRGKRKRCLSRLKRSLSERSKSLISGTAGRQCVSLLSHDNRLKTLQLLGFRCFVDFCGKSWKYVYKSWKRENVKLYTKLLQ